VNMIAIAVIIAQLNVALMSLSPVKRVRMLSGLITLQVRPQLLQSTFFFSPHFSICILASYRCLPLYVIIPSLRSFFSFFLSFIHYLNMPTLIYIIK
jgi:hypothetical protein